MPAQAEDTQEYVKGETRLGDVPGSERILSVTDRAVSPSDVPADSTQVAEGPSSSFSSPLPSSGWIAKRSPDMRR